MDTTKTYPDNWELVATAPEGDYCNNEAELYAVKDFWGGWKCIVVFVDGDLKQFKRTFETREDLIDWLDVRYSACYGFEFVK